jgi:hypothetical protein
LVASSSKPLSREAIRRLVEIGLMAKEDEHQPAEPRINFEAPAVLRKWPSLRGERRTEGTLPYLLVEGTLDECVRALMAKPASVRHLYEIHTSPQPPLVSPVLSGERVFELALLQDL